MSHLYEDAKTYFIKRGMGINGSVEVDLPAMMNHKSTSVRALTKGTEGKVAASGEEAIDYLNGGAGPSKRRLS